MKTRNGFISNSSSASFIVHWRMRTFGEKVTTKEALAHLFGINSYDKKTNKIDWGKNWTQDYQEKFESIERLTRQNNNGEFITLFDTICLNFYDDFGDSAKTLVFSLVADDDFEIIDAKTQNDN